MSVNGLLYVTPFTDYLKKDLQFYDMVPLVKKISFRDKKTGEMKEFDKRDGYEHKSIDLFTVCEENSTGITHKGLFRRIAGLIHKNGDTFSFDDKDPLKEFFFDKSVIDGLRPEQVRVLLNILGEINTGQDGWKSGKPVPPPGAGSGGALVEATMSTGKTHIIAALLKCFPTSQCLVVTKKRSVMSRLLSGLSELLPGQKIGIFHGTKKDKQRITVCSEALLDAFDTSQVSLIIYDEVHNASGAVVSSTLLCFNKAIKVGLSGTLRKHLKRKFIEAIFGPIVDVITDEEAEEKDMVSAIKIYALHVPRGPDISRYEDVALERWGITNNQIRNEMIRDVVVAIPPDLQLIIFVRTIEHMANLCENFLSGDFVQYHGQLSAKEREIIEAKIISGELKRIVANDALSEGVNTTKLRVMIEAGWSITDQTVSQRAGRGRRKDKGKNLGVIVTFLDDWEIPDLLQGMTKSNPLQARAEKRISNYKSRGWPILKIHNPDEINFSEIQDAEVDSKLVRDSS